MYIHLDGERKMPAQRHGPHFAIRHSTDVCEDKYEYVKTMVHNMQIPHTGSVRLRLHG